MGFRRELGQLWHGRGRRRTPDAVDAKAAREIGELNLGLPWHAVAWAGDQPEELWARQDKVEYLRDEEQQQCL